VQNKNKNKKTNPVMKLTFSGVLLTSNFQGIFSTGYSSSIAR
jgi:hypothetical protein